MKHVFPRELQTAVDAAAEAWTRDGNTERFWNRDAALWTNADEAKWMGWLDIARRQLEHRDRFHKVTGHVKQLKVRNAVLLGMGGSSLCPEVLSLTFGHKDSSPALHVLDSTDPAQVLAIEALSDPRETLYIVSSKSGTTLEPNIFKQYFFEKSGKAAEHFIAITDPGSKMQKVAEADNFELICYGDASIGGRYSALSDFGMIPGAAMGLDVVKLLERSEDMAKDCREPDAAKNPGVLLGLALGTAAKHGQDKVTLVASPAVLDLGAWLEQLIAESTGKIGRGLIPVDREPLGAPQTYGNDRVFAYIRYSREPDGAQDKAIEALEKAGQPVIHLDVHDLYDLGAEFFRWEIATAVAGAVISIDPFDQPDVEASKVATRKLTDEFESTGKLPPEQPILEADGFKFFTDVDNAAQLIEKTPIGNTPAGNRAADILRAHLSRLHAGDYFALLAYIQRTAGHQDALESIRVAVRDKKKVATCLGFGPRFLHSTGQAYKGGPNSGVFLQVTCDDAEDVPIPGQKYTFGIVKAAQARGDFDVLAQRKRRSLRVHLPADLHTALPKLAAAITEALS